MFFFFLFVMLCCVVLFVFVCSSSVACLLARSLSEPVLTMKYQSHESCCDTRQTELAFQADGHVKIGGVLLNFRSRQNKKVRSEHIDFAVFVFLHSLTLV